MTPNPRVTYDMMFPWSFHGVSGKEVQETCPQRSPAQVASCGSLKDSKHWTKRSTQFHLSKMSLVELAGANHPQPIVSFARYLGQMAIQAAHLLITSQPIVSPNPIWTSNLGKHVNSCDS